MKQLSNEEWNEIQVRMMQFGRKAPTAAELRAQWLEQQRHEAEIRQRFTIAERL